MPVTNFLLRQAEVVMRHNTCNQQQCLFLRGMLAQHRSHQFSTSTRKPAQKYTPQGDAKLSAISLSNLQQK